MNFEFLSVSDKPSGMKYNLTLKLVGLIRKFLGYELMVAQHSDNMLTIEQAANITSLVEQVVAYQIDGAIVECGSFTGSTAIHIQNTLKKNSSKKEFHVFDSFDKKFFYKGKNTLEAFKDNFSKFNLELPIMHAGFFNETIPMQLPPKIAFAHIDCGFGDKPENHAQLIINLLNDIYPRMPKGAIGLMMDYHDNDLTVGGHDANPGVITGCAKFFADKPERVSTLYGGKFSHGYFRKQ